MAEDFDDVSPYNYGMNNPISMIDPDGMAAIYQQDGSWLYLGPDHPQLGNMQEPVGFRSTVVDGSGKIIDHKNDGDNSVYQLIDNKKYKIGTEKVGIDYNQLIGKQLGSLQYDPKSFDLDEVQVTAKKPNSALGAIGIGLALRTGGLWGAEGLDPEPVTKAIGGVALTAYSAYVVGQLAVDFITTKIKLRNGIEELMP